MIISMRHGWQFVLCLTALLSIASCETADKPSGLKLTPTSFADLAGWQDDNVSAFLPALQRSCALHLRRPADRPVKPAGFGLTAGHWHDVCTRLMDLPAGDDQAARQAIETWFTVWRAEDTAEDAKGVATGYYEPQLRGALNRFGPYQTPLYKTPPELVDGQSRRFQ